MTHQDANSTNCISSRSANHLADAESALALVKTEDQLLTWHDKFCTGYDYVNMRDEDAKVLDEFYRRKAGWFMGVGAG